MTTGSPCTQIRRDVHSPPNPRPVVVREDFGRHNASTGLDDFEWGVTVFAVLPDDLKDVVHTTRYGQASALYAEFGPFHTGVVAPIEEALAELEVS